MKRLARCLATAVAVTALVAGPAYASVNGDYRGDGVRIRTGPHLYNTVLGLGYQGQGATLYCITNGSSVNGNTQWEYNRDKATGVTGYSSDYYMNWSGSLPHC
jgi:hypothetical protein